MEFVKEMLPFLQLTARIDVKAVAIQNLLELSGSDEGVKLMSQSPILLSSFIALLRDKNDLISKQTSLALVNISATEGGAEAILRLNDEKPALHSLLSLITDPDSSLADAACIILSNASRSPENAETIAKEILSGETVAIEEILIALSVLNHNKRGCALHHLGQILSNLTQATSIRLRLLDRDHPQMLQRLLPFTEFKKSIVRRAGVVGALRNCCLETDAHDWLLGTEVDILPRLLLPLAGGDMQIDDEDQEKLPPELQYLEESHNREPDAAIRIMLLEAITQLCATRKSRDIIRECNAYVILRELHKWEKDKKALLACENLVDILIRTEDEIAHDNLKEIDVPADLQEKFEKMDRDFLEDDVKAS